MRLILILFLAALSGCGSRYFVPMVTETVTDPDGTVTVTDHTENSHIQKTISSSKPEPCSKTVADLDKDAQRDYMLLHAAGKTPPLCDTRSVASGRNFFDMKTERHAAAMKTTSDVIDDVASVAKIDVIGDTIGKVTREIGSRSHNTTYNTDIQATQSNSSALDGGSDLGSPSTTEGAIRSNSITIGGNSALAGDRAASGETALVNGDSSVISSVEDSEVKGSDTAEDINKPNDQSTFDDSDGNPTIDI